MKRSLKACYGLSLLLYSALSAYHGEDNDPFEFDLNGYIIADQHITKDSSGASINRLAGTNVQFGEAHVGTIYHYLCSGCCEEYMMGAGYTYSRLDWKANPYFKQKNFNAVNMDLGLKWGCLCDWDLNVFTRTFLDTDSPNVAHYLCFDITAWGRLKHRENLGLHLGTLIFTGMKVDRMYPIFGIDWKPTDYLKFNLIYPVDMNVQFMFTDYFAASIGARLIYSRHRVRNQDDYEDFNPFGLDQGLEDSHARQYFDFGDLEVPTNTPFPPQNFPNYLNPRAFARAIWEYRAWGLEAALTYNCLENLVGRVYGGWSFNGHLTIGAHSWNHKQTYKLKSAPYVGADFSFRF